MRGRAPVGCCRVCHVPVGRGHADGCALDDGGRPVGIEHLERGMRPCPSDRGSCGGPDAFDGCQMPATCYAGPVQTLRRLREDQDVRDAMAPALAFGLTRPAGVPDCATLSVGEDGSLAWRWVQVGGRLLDDGEPLPLARALDESYGATWRCSGMGV